MAINSMLGRAETDEYKEEQKFMKTLMIVCCLLCCVAGCSKDSDYYEKRNRAAWQACIDKGGIPIQSIWIETLLADCIFPPKDSKRDKK